MIARLWGKLKAKGPDYLIVDVGGIGFQVYAPAEVVDGAGAEGSPVSLFTHLHVRENELALYGFAEEDDLRLFKQLLSVSGIGPKVALGFLSAMPADALRMAIAEGKVDVLTQVPGVGKKTAQRLVVELKGKLDLTRVAAEEEAWTFAEGEVIAALTNLGYSVAEAQAAVRKLPQDPNLTLEEKVLLALRSFGQG